MLSNLSERKEAGAKLTNAIANVVVDFIDENKEYDDFESIIIITLTGILSRLIYNSNEDTEGREAMLHNISIMLVQGSILSVDELGIPKMNH